MDQNRQISVDSAELRALAGELSKLASSIADTAAALDRGLDHLGTTFGGDDYNQFREVYRKSRHKLLEFVTETRKLAPLLRQDADAVDRAKAVNLGG